jgi:hypothetical protein
MKKILSLFAVLAALPAFACDICGSGSSAINPFLFPQLSRNYAGMQLLHRSFHRHSKEGLNTHSTYISYIASAQVSISPKWQIGVFIPYQQLSWSNGINSIRQSGIGDVSLLVSYKLFDNKNVLSQTAFIGAGLKLCTGHYSADHAVLAEPGFQAGTGSVDYSLSGTYRLGYQQWVLGLTGSYKYNTVNSQGYRFGDVLTMGGTLAWNKPLGKVAIAPYVQVISEKQYADAHEHALQSETASSAMYSGVGLDVTTSQFTIGVSYQSDAKEMVTGIFNSNPRLSGRLVFTF